MDDIRQGQINALMANGSYLKSKEGLQERTNTIQDINDNYEEWMSNFLDPESEVDISDNPFFKAGAEGFERLKYDIESGVVKQI